MTDTTFTFDGISSTTIPELLVVRVRRPFVAKRRDDFVEVPGREGFWLFQEQPGARMLTIEFDFLADSFDDRRAAVTALADLLDGPDGLAELIFSDEPDRFHRARLASEPDPEEWLTRAAFSVDLIAEPYALALEISEESYTAATGVSHPFSIPDTIGAPCEVEILANGGTLTGLVIVANGETLVRGLGVTVFDGETITFSTLSYTATIGPSIDTDLDGTFDPDNLSMSTVSGDFPVIVAGANTIAVTRTGTAATMTITVRWRRRFR